MGTGGIKLAKWTWARVGLSSACLDVGVALQSHDSPTAKGLPSHDFLLCALSFISV